VQTEAVPVNVAQMPPAISPITKCSFYEYLKFFYVLSTRQSRLNTTSHLSAQFDGQLFDGQD